MNKQMNEIIETVERERERERELFSIQQEKYQ